MSERTFRTTGRLTPEAEVDLEACHTDPIHRTAYIQPHGTFLEVDPHAHTVLSAAGNLESYLGCPAEEAIGLPLTELFASASLERIGRWPRGVSQSTERYVFDEGGRSLSVTLFPADESTGIEVEHPPGEDEVAEEVVLNARPVLDRLRGITDRDELFEETVAAVRSFAAFERVMLYRFDEEGHGQVVAEDRRPDVGSYLGQHFPASDIPEPARRLYRENRVRHIPDVEYDPVPILGPEGTRERAEMDLTFSSLRGVPNVHRQYLRNMGVRASTSISVLVEGELWGLIACHGLEPRLLGWARRNVCELVGHTVSQQIARIRAEEQEERLGTVERFSGRFRPPGDVDELFAQLESERSALLSLLDAGGFYLQLGEHTLWLGEDGFTGEPPVDLMEHITTRLEEEKIVGVRSVVAEAPGLDWERSEAVSGFLAVRLARSRRNFCVWFRPEERERVEWGGDPRNPVSVGPQGELSPRDSFEAWTQIVSDRCRAWTELDRVTARELGKLLDEMIIEVQAGRLRRANRILQERNEALEEARSDLQEANEARQRLLEEMKEQARTDELTGLANRRALIDRLEEEIDRARRYSSPLSVAILDLDHFKEINDTLGHQAGDQVLSRLGELLAEETRAPDVAGRYGGEEFALVLPQTGREEARRLAERVREAVEGLEFEAEGEPFGVTCSLGLAEMEESEGMDHLVKRADDALYRAKEEGRNRVVAV